MGLGLGGGQQAGAKIKKKKKVPGQAGTSEKGGKRRIRGGPLLLPRGNQRGDLRRNSAEKKRSGHEKTEVVPLGGGKLKNGGLPDQKKGIPQG